MNTFEQRLERLQPFMPHVRGVAEDVHDAQRFQRAGVNTLADIALQAAECKAGLIDRITPREASV